MTRKLLPYEYDLIDALGVSKEEYLDFVAKQQTYQDIKEGTQLDIQNGPAVAIVLAVIGLIFNVVSALLLRPQVPTFDRTGAEQTRDQRLAPRLGFNGSQELASYGDPVPLVYTNTNQNSDGGVRLSTLLLWSAILSFGNNQFMRLMMTLGAANIGSIDAERTALGQFPAKDLVSSNVWQYYSQNGATRFSNLARGNTSDPVFTSPNDTTVKLNGLPGNVEGFSQAYSPTTSNSAGVTGFIPINFDVLVLNSAGYEQRSRVDTSFKPVSGTYWDSSTNRPFVPVGSRWNLIIPDTAAALLTSDTAGIARQDALRVDAALVDNGSIFKAGSVIFRVVSVSYSNQGSSIEEGSMTVAMECIRTGIMPALSYDNPHWLVPGEAAAGNLTINTAPYHTKGLARIEEAAYASVTRCNVIDLALRAQVYRRISGRSSVYGSDQANYGHNASDNGVKARTSMFVVWYRMDGAGDFSRIPFIFCVRGTTEQNVFTYLKLFSAATPRFWEIKLEAVVDTYQEIRSFYTRGYCYLNPNAPLVRLNTSATTDSRLEVFYNGSLYFDAQRTDFPPFNKTPPHSSELDLFNYDAYTQTSFSFDNSPEINITAVNEQTTTPWSTYSPTLYQGLSNFGLHVVSGAGTQDLRSVSVWVNQGKLLRPISTALDTYGNEATGSSNDGAIASLAASSPSVSSSYAPDVFLDTVLDATNGIGKYASLHSVDVMQLAQSKRFCERNRLFFDGVIADVRSWRDFWAQTAPFSLLELGKIGGRDTLVPALPYDKSTGQIVRGVSITALFNTSNILEDSYKEEFIDYGSNVQDVIVTLVYRDVERNGIFPRNNSVQVRRTDTNENNAIRETLDLSQFVTTRTQAILLGKFLCNSRRYNRRAVEFKTFPTDSFIMPGSYIYVETAMNQWDGIYTGRVEEGGALSVPIASSVPNGTYNVMTYGSTDGVRTFASVSVVNGTAATLASMAGQLFVLGQAVNSKRVFRITEVSMEEEGETTVRAIEHPCETVGASSRSLISQGISGYSAGLFTIDGQAE